MYPAGVMRPLSCERAGFRRRLGWVLALAGLLVVMLTDRRLFHMLYVGAAEKPRLAEQWWFQALYFTGTVWFWLGIGVLLGVLDRGPARAWRVPAAAALAGAAAEVAKLLVGRERPIDNGVADGAYVYKGLLERFTDPAHGMPSSHAAVAFGGAIALGLLIPRAMPVAVLAAAGCGLVRLLPGAHFASDVYVGALMGGVAAWLLARPRHGRM
jgi:membrane-associated phospholipid phosphatase